MGKRKYDFAGWVTKNDIRCSDGVTIKHNAFRDNDGQKVPLVWNHTYNSPTNVLGHVLLQNKDNGVYGYGYFNETEEAANAKELVKHGDISSMSIGARKLKKSGSDIIHGLIYEVSLVLSGANPGAMIDTVMQHSDDGTKNEKTIVYSGNLIHSSDDVLENEEDFEEDEYEEEDEDVEKTIEEILETMTEEQQEAVGAIIDMMADPESADYDHDEVKEIYDTMNEEQQEVTHSLIEAYEEILKHSDEDATIGDIIDTMNEEQQEAVFALMGMMADDEDEDYNYEDEEEGDDEVMKQNVFSKGVTGREEMVLKHSMNEALKAAQNDKASSLKDYLAETQEETLTHGINSIEMLFPEAAQSTNGNVPILYKDTNTAYARILDGVAKSPFSRVKTTIADLTEEEARAKGYIKGNMKKEEYFSLIKRVTSPTTVYKKQKLDRDDIIDIQDFDVVAFMNVEMQMMLKEEIARALLVGDGRDFSAEDKISEQHIRPIIGDHEFFTIQKNFAAVADFIEAVILAMAEYKGSGRPDLYIDPTLLAKVKLLKATDGRFLFGDIPSNEAIANRLGLGDIIPTTFMTGKGALIVNLRDYTLGATKGGQVTNFDDFDIDFNQHKYLIETRLCGALTMPKSAIHLVEGGAAGTGATATNAGMTFGERQADKVTP